MRILYIFIVLITLCNTSHAKSLDEMNANTSPDITNDLIYSQDVSDTSEAYTGTGKSLTIKNLLRAGNITVDGTNVGISTTTPQQKLQVVGTVQATAFIGDGSGLTGVAASASDAAYSSSWNGDTTGIASKNALYDKIETISVSGSGMNWDSYDAISSLSNGNQFLVNDSGTNKDINWENIQQIAGFDASVTYNVKQYGAKGDGIQAFDGAITSGTPNFTSATASFTSADVGKVITIQNAGGTDTDLTTTISAYVSATAVTLTSNASATVSGSSYTYGTDDTNAIRSVLSNIGIDATVGKTAIVFFPEGTYIINGSFDQINNSQLGLPIVAFNEPYTHITFKGASITASNGKVNNGTVIYGTKYGTNGSYSVMSVTDSGGGGTGNIADVSVNFENIRFRTVQDPTHTVLDLEDVGQAQGNNVVFDTSSTYTSPTLPTHSGSFALKLPGLLAGNVSGGWRNLKIKTYYNGVMLGEHSLIWDTFIVQCVNALVFTDVRYPAEVLHASVESVQNSVVVSGSINSYFTIYSLDLEHNTGTFANATNLIDSSNLGVGTINYSVFNNGGGATFTKSGGKNVSLFNIKTNFSERRSATQEQRIINTGTDSTTSGGSLMLMQNDHTALGAGQRIGLLGFAGSYNTSGTDYVYGASIQALTAEAFTASAAGTDLQFRTTPIGATTAVENVRITSEGNVGVGTINPSKKLHVTGDARITGLVSCDTIDTDSSGNLACGTDDGGSGSVGIGTANTITFWPTTTTIGSLPTATYPSLTELSYVKGATSSLQTQIDGLSVGSGGWTDGGANVYTTTTTDNIGIGTTIPIHRVAIRGATTSSLGITNNSSSSSSAGAGIQAISDDNAAVVLGDRLAFYTFGGSADTGDTIANGGAITGYADGTWSATSAPTEVRIEVAPSGSTTRAVALVADSTSNVGIGTTTPQQKLQVVGTIAATSYTGDGSALTGVGSGGWVDGGTNVYVSPTTDNVGIGTTTPSTNFKADIRGNLYVSGNVGIGTLLPRGSLDLGPTGTVYAQTFTGPTGPTILGTANNVGIGTITAGSLLTVGSTGQVTVSSAGAVATSSTVSVADDAYAAGWNGSTAVPTKNAVYDKIETIGAGSWTDAGVFLYATTTSDNVGIGTVAPSEKLEIVSTTATDAALLLRNSESTGLAKVSVFNSDDKGFGMVATGSGYAIPNFFGPLVTSGDNLGFGEFDGTINMTISGTGNVGIGSTAPNGSLDIRNTTSAIGWTVKTGANTACNTTCTSACVFGQDTGTSNGPIVACSDAAADRCLCAGSD